MAGLVCVDGMCRNPECAEQPSCNKLDPIERDKCVKARDTWDRYSGDKTAYTLACGADSRLQSEAEKIVNCALDPRTCACP